MPSYLLLRSNKECGPYSLDQLIQLGLKPYDLVWVEGRSAAWRYPSEVAELKEYAPVTEEQPYDRFYKKPVEEKHRFETVTETRQESFTPVILENKKTTTKVFVSLPVNKPVNNEPLVKKVNPVIIPEPVETRKVIAVEEKTELKQEYSQPLDEIKKMYTETYLKRKKKISNKKNLGAMLKVAGGVAFVSIVAIVVYQNFSPDKKAEKQISSVNSKPQINSDNIPVTSLTDETDQKTASFSNENYTSVSGKRVEPVVKTNSEQPLKKPAAKAIVPEKKDTPKETTIDENADGGKVVIDPSTGQRKKSSRGESEEPAKETKETIVKFADINSLASVNANNYKRRPFGGIFDLQLTVNNDSKFILDKVTVELQYLKPSEQPIKTDKITFSSIAPNGSQTIKLPDYLRGIKVVYKVVDVESNQYDKHLAGL